jgi:hypothetical protein
MAARKKALTTRHDLTATLELSNGVKLELSSRVATIAAVLGLYQKAIDALPIGKLEVRFAGEQVTVDLGRDLPPIEVRDRSELNAALSTIEKLGALR